MRLARRPDVPTLMLLVAALGVIPAVRAQSGTTVRSVGADSSRLGTQEIDYGDGNRVIAPRLPANLAASVPPLSRVSRGKIRRIGASKAWNERIQARKQAMLARSQRARAKVSSRRSARFTAARKRLSAMRSHRHGRLITPDGVLPASTPGEMQGRPGRRSSIRAVSPPEATQAPEEPAPKPPPWGAPGQAAALYRQHGFTSSGERIEKKDEDPWAAYRKSGREKRARSSGPARIGSGP